MSLVLTPLIHLPLINPGDDISGLLIEATRQQDIEIRDGDILAITSKIISKAEGRFANLADVNPSEKAVELSKNHNKDARLIELILQESREVIRVTRQTIIVEHRLGFICANAGIDHSNVKPISSDADEWYLLLPKEPEISARHIQHYFKERMEMNIGVIIIDSQGRPWRHGTVGMTIGTAGVPALVDLRGKKDLFSYRLLITQVSAADELAGASSLMMGQADESIPAVHVRGFPYDLRESSIQELIRAKEEDLFR
jgi:coenzyme F420-0:L-glutamate ligase/coenzyme F420-1:gamma-L-glutamate ligase